MLFRSVAYWPLGLLEHHGWALPVGYDGIKADRICQRLADHTGGVILPTMWWGGGGGHGAFRDRKSVVEGKRVDLGGRRLMKKKN